MKLETLINQARGGKVVRTGFVDIAEFDRRSFPEDIKVLMSGGFADSLRVVYTFYPENIPKVEDPVKVYRLNIDFPDVNANEIRVSLGFSADLCGDLREYKGSFLIAVTGQAIKMLENLQTIVLRGQSVPIEVEQYFDDQTKQTKTKTVVVPSLRVDVVGAKGFGVSRSYFQAGIAGRKVRLNGQIATPSSDIKEGDILIADSLGQVEFKRIINETKRGNYKLELVFHR